MCLIIHKPANIPMPSNRKMKKAFKANPDGAGIGIRFKDSWNVSKGFMAIGNFMREMKSYKDFLYDREVVLHFRLGTSGMDKPGNCHPFPITDDVNLLRSLDYESNWIMAHNGIFGGGQTIKDYGVITDTQVYIREVLNNPIIKNGLVNNVDETMKILSYTLGTDRIIIGGPKVTIRFGKWHEIQGCLYSNEYWKTKPIANNLGETWTLNPDTGTWESTSNKEWEGWDREKCPSCGKETYDTLTGYCSNCGLTEEDIIELEEAKETSNKQKDENDEGKMNND